MVHVLHIISGLEIGGAETALYRLIDASQESGYLHSVACLSAAGPISERLVKSNIETHHFPLKQSPILELIRLCVLIIRSKPAIVQTWMYHADFIGGVIARICGNAKVIWGVRTTDLVASSSRRTEILRSYCAALSRLVPHAIICAADASRRSHISIGYKASLFHVIPNGFSLTGFSVSSAHREVIRLQFGFSEDHRVVGCVGRFHPAKDHHNFVQAARLVAVKHADVRFLMIGRGLDSHNAELAGWLAQTGVADRFLLLGERSDVPLCLAAMDIFCLPSRTEGFPNVVGEAMAMGLPCVVTDVGDASYLLGDGGVVVPKEDSQLLASGLLRLLSMSDQERMDLGARGKARVAAEFSMERTRERFEAVYRHVLAKERS
jgi:glycosyltransferase involved in cell wall biosynthesis